MLVLLCLSTLLSQLAYAATIVVDGVSEWKNPTVHIGDSIIFRHKNHYNLFIFQNQGAFNSCNFTQATLLSKQSSTSYTWRPSRPGLFYFSFNNGSLDSCLGCQKIAVKVSASSPPSPSLSAAPSEVPPIAAPEPSSGGEVSSSPSFPWPFQPRQAASPTGLPPSAGSPVTVPSFVPDKGGMPFINSNPAVPLPTGEVDSATIRPIPISGHAGKVKGSLVAVQVALLSGILLML